MHAHAVRQIGRPGPEDEIAHGGARTIGERRHQNSCRAPRHQSSYNTPRRRQPIIGKIVCPGARHIAKIDACLSTSPFGPQVEDVLNIDFVGAYREGRKALRKTMAHFDEQAFNRKTEIKSGRSTRIETTALQSGTFAGDRRERPFRIMTAIAGSAKPQANPPTATWSR